MHMEGLLPPLASLALLLMAPCCYSTMPSGSTLISLPSLGLLVTCAANAPAQAERAHHTKAATTGSKHESTCDAPQGFVKCI